jgi:hypothetical protein
MVPNPASRCPFHVRCDKQPFKIKTTHRPFEKTHIPVFSLVFRLSPFLSNVIQSYREPSILKSSLKISTRRKYDQRRFIIEESASLNGGKRTIFIETVTPGTSVPPHFPTRFSETLDLVSGSMTVHKTDEPDSEKLEASAQNL